ncbi:MAG TPA: hypothetical protein VGS20_15265 [Candidatus Acidoferrales bacterium]|nr:hypothetical protein [Candidatus Acidoferrales bacterium]
MAVRNGYQMAVELHMVEPRGLNASEGSWYRFAGSPIGPGAAPKRPMEE